MRNPLKILQEEHNILLSAVKLGLNIQKVENNEEYRHLVNDFILFIRNYSEIYHFPKEEQFLYPILRNRSEQMGEEFLYEIYDNHEDFRAMVSEIEIHFANYNHDLLRSVMTRYLREMFDHMNQENRVVLNNASALLTEQEMESLYEKFMIHDEKHGEKKHLERDFYKISVELS
ncbi:MAG TPA: hemerythrin domain-containing protein [Bacteroidia bacterium]|nr:hemerythrin domain-containing protein [Bacteroidia bacterium]